ncbi:hypothetical protein GCM10023168_13280 [Fodinibacter luteus]|uniref:DUF998 domain-containing protein n=1 Tax=Fodinibacter luteus TaxID=552064 RepID=A0ABP8K9Q6_9MICO
MSAGGAAGVRERWARHRRPLLVAAAVGAAGLSVVWFLVVPDAAEAATGWRAVVLRHGHGACWSLLAASLVVGAADGPSRLRGGLAWAGLGCYVAFLAALASS